MEAAIGFEPMNGGFADLSLNHLGTPPLSPDLQLCRLPDYQITSLPAATPGRRSITARSAILKPRPPTLYGARYSD